MPFLFLDVLLLSGDVVTERRLADAEPLLAVEDDGFGGHGGGNPLPLAGANQWQRLARQHHHPSVDHLLDSLGAHFVADLLQLGAQRPVGVIAE